MERNKSRRRTRVGAKPKSLSFFRNSHDLGTQNHDFVRRKNSPTGAHFLRFIQSYVLATVFFEDFEIPVFLQHTDVSGESVSDSDMIYLKDVRMLMMMLPLRRRS